MYCTGGVRCEAAAPLLARRLREAAERGGGGGGFELAQLSGGIHRYLEAFPDGGFFRGQNYVFDRRGAHGPAAGGGAREPAGAAPRTIAQCALCERPWDTYPEKRRRCRRCNMAVLVCALCLSRGEDRRATLLCELCDEPDDARADCAAGPDAGGEPERGPQ